MEVNRPLRTVSCALRTTTMLASLNMYLSPYYDHWMSTDRVFDTESNQNEVYEYAAKPILDDVLQGYNGCLLAYGQVGPRSLVSSTLSWTFLHERICRRGLEKHTQWLDRHLMMMNHEELSLELSISFLTRLSMPMNGE